MHLPWTSARRVCFLCSQTISTIKLFSTVVFVAGVKPFSQHAIADECGGLTANKWTNSLQRKVSSLSGRLRGVPASCKLLCTQLFACDRFDRILTVEVSRSIDGFTWYVLARKLHVILAVDLDIKVFTTRAFFYLVDIHWYFTALRPSDYLFGRSRREIDHDFFKAWNVLHREKTASNAIAIDIYF